MIVGAELSDESVCCLAVDRLSKSFGGLKAVNSVDLAVKEGERRAIIGPNGAGKTTLFNLISGELAPSTGKIIFFGRDVTRMPVHRRAYLGMARTFQITNLFPNLTVMENLLLAAQALEATKFSMHRPITSYRHLFESAKWILKSVEMSEKADEVVRNLSHGEQRQIEVGLALIGRPRLLLFDEPTAGLSPGETTMMVSLLKRLDPATTMLIIEHDMDVAFELADNITVLHYGEIIADGSRDIIKSNRMVQEIYLGLE